MDAISVTFEVSKPEMLMEVTDSHPENIWYISVTFAVLKLERSREVIDLHPENMPSIAVMFAVLKLERSMDCSFPQLPNIYDMLVAAEVSSLSMPSMVSRFWKS